MTVDIEGDLNRAMPEEGLQLLWRKAPLDRPRGEEVAERVEPIFRLTGRVDDAGRELERLEAPIRDVAVTLDVTATVGKDELQLALRAGETPLF